MQSFNKLVKDVTHLCEETYFHHCMYGSKRRKYTKLLHINCKHLCALAKQCNGRHWRLPWGYNHGRWATHAETAYPNGLCRAYASCFRNYLLSTGHLEPSVSLQMTNMPVNNVKLNQIGSGKQPRGKALPPLVSEFAAVFFCCCQRKFATTTWQTFQTVACPAFSKSQWPI